MRHLIVRLRHPAALLVAIPAIVTLLAIVAWNPAPAAHIQSRYTVAEQAYMDEMARILDVDHVLPEGSLAGGHNACWLIDHYGLNPDTLQGWERIWSYEWEREWLAAAVRWICPVGT